jgi:hypothetical protein
MSSFLPSKDLVNLSQTSKKMSAVIGEVALKIIASSHVRYGGDVGDGSYSLDDDTDNNSQKKKKKKKKSKKKKKKPMPALEQLHLLLYSPLEFTTLMGGRLEYVRGDKACVHSSNPNPLHTPFFIDRMNMLSDGDWDDWEGETVTAMCTDYVMTSGRHYAKFIISGCENGDDLGNAFRYFYCRIGIIRPIGTSCRKTALTESEWCPIHDQLFARIFLGESFAEYHRTKSWGESNVHCCLYYEFDGTCEWTNWDSTNEGIHKKQRWNGMRGYDFVHARKFGLLLDLDEGTLSVYDENDRRLGVMMSGLTGEYCWVANILAQANGSPDQQNVRIEKAPVPA